MAFTYCTNCGEKIDMGQKNCPHCGHVISDGYSYGAENYNANNAEQSTPSGGAGFDPQCREDDRSRQSGYQGQSGSRQGQSGSRQGQSYNGGQYGSGQQGQGYNGGQYYGAPLYRTPIMPQKRPISVGLVIFSIINILFSCCTFTSLIFGIIALVYTVGAQKAQSEAEETAKKKTALVLNIVGLVIGLFSMVSFMVLFVDILKEIAQTGVQ